MIIDNITHMHIITVSMYNDRSQREKDRLAEAITDDTVKTLQIKKEDVIVVYNESPRGNWFAAGIRI